MAEPAERLLARLKVPGGGLEGAESQVDLGDARVRSSLEASREMLCRAAERDERASVDCDLIGRLLEDAERGFARLGGDGPDAALQPAERYALEAVIETDGTRPVLFVQDGTIPGDAPELANWGAAAAFRPQIERVAASVGRVEAAHIEAGKAGTMFMIAPGLVVTNRHVLEGLCQWDGSAWRYYSDASVDFVGEHQRDRTRRYRLGEVVYWGPDAINWRIDFKLLDVAIFRLVEGAEPFPAPLSFERNPDRYRPTVGGGPRHVYTIGFPGEPQVAEDDPADGPPPAGHEYQQVVDNVFRSTFGVKRWAPGEIEAAPGEVDGDAKAWVFSHDASTLGGSSGSCVVDFQDNGERVLGIHFGGRARVVNWAHAFAALKPFLPDGIGAAWL